jgi:hypothetical protein
MAANFYREVIVFGKCEKHGGGGSVETALKYKVKDRCKI